MADQGSSDRPSIETGLMITFDSIGSGVTGEVRFLCDAEPRQGEAGLYHAKERRRSDGDGFTTERSGGDRVPDPRVETSAKPPLLRGLT